VTLIPPSRAPNFDGSSLNAPELAGIDNPIEGTWIAIVDGFSMLFAQWRQVRSEARCRWENHQGEIARQAVAIRSAILFMPGSRFGPKPSLTPSM
jgi:hypothetical protein